VTEVLLHYPLKTLYHIISSYGPRTVRLTLTDPRAKKNFAPGACRTRDPEAQWCNSYRALYHWTKQALGDPVRVKEFSGIFLLETNVEPNEDMSTPITVIIMCWWFGEEFAIVLFATTAVSDQWPL